MRYGPIRGTAWDETRFVSDLSSNSSCYIYVHGRSYWNSQLWNGARYRYFPKLPLVIPSLESFVLAGTEGENDRFRSVFEPGISRTR